MIFKSIIRKFKDKEFRDLPLWFLCSFALSIFIALKAFNGRWCDPDTFAYWLQSRAFLKGFISWPGLDMFQLLPSISLTNDNGIWIARYAPLNSLVLAVFEFFHAPWLMGPVLHFFSLIVILFFLDDLLKDKRQTSWILRFLSIHPLALFIPATWFSENLSLFLASLFLFSFHRWLSTNNKNVSKYALICGIAWGAELLNRPVMAIALLIWALMSCIYFYKQNKSAMLLHFRPGLLRALSVSIIFVFMLLGWNYTITGSPWQMSHGYLHDEDRYGFGYRNGNLYRDSSINLNESGLNFNAQTSIDRILKMILPALGQNLWALPFLHYSDFDEPIVRARQAFSGFQATKNNQTTWRFGTLGGNWGHVSLVFENKLNESLFVHRWMFPAQNSAAEFRFGISKIHPDKIDFSLQNKINNEIYDFSTENVADETVHFILRLEEPRTFAQFDLMRMSEESKAISWSGDWNYHHLENPFQAPNFVSTYSMSQAPVELRTAVSENAKLDLKITYGSEEEIKAHRRWILFLPWILVLMGLLSLSAYILPLSFATIVFYLYGFFFFDASYVSMTPLASRYYYEVSQLCLMPLAIIGLMRIRVRGILILIFILSLASTIYMSQKWVADFRLRTVQYEKVQADVTAISKPAIIFMTSRMGFMPWLADVSEVPQALFYNLTDTEVTLPLDTQNIFEIWNNHFSDRTPYFWDGDKVFPLHFKKDSH